MAAVSRVNWVIGRSVKGIVREGHTRGRGVGERLLVGVEMAHEWGRVALTERDKVARFI